MNKDYMLRMVQQRLTVLRTQYRNACNGKTLTGKDASYMGAAVLRSRLKKEICIITLLEELLLTADDDLYIDNEDAELGFDKLMKE